MVWNSQMGVHVYLYSRPLKRHSRHSLHETLGSGEFKIKYSKYLLGPNPVDSPAGTAGGLQGG